MLIHDRAPLSPAPLCLSVARHFGASIQQFNTLRTCAAGLPAPFLSGPPRRGSSMGSSRPHRLPGYVVLDMLSLYPVISKLLSYLRNDMKSLLCYFGLSKVSGRVVLNYFSFAFLIFLSPLMNRLLIDLVIRNVGGGTVLPVPMGRRRTCQKSRPLG